MRGATVRARRYRSPCSLPFCSSPPFSTLPPHAPAVSVPALGAVLRGERASMRQAGAEEGTAMARILIISKRRSMPI
jgi:hypothetical protein